MRPRYWPLGRAGSAFRVWERDVQVAPLSSLRQMSPKVPRGHFMGSGGEPLLALGGVWWSVQALTPEISQELPPTKRRFQVASARTAAPFGKSVNSNVAPPSCD